MKESNVFFLLRMVESYKLNKIKRKTWLNDYKTCLLAETQQQRRLSVSLLQDVYYVFPETDLTISVNVSFPLTENYMVTWKHKEKNSDFAEDINNRNLGIKYAGGSLGQPSLTINNVTDFDAGEYFIEIQPIEVADSGSSAGPATVHVLSKKSSKS